jgi:multidrug resistance efflux pump
MVNKKWFTWFLIIFIVLLPVPTLIHHLQSFIVRNAVVTAYRYEVRAPIDGVIEVLARPGTFSKGSPALILRNRRIPRAEIDGLEAKHQAGLQYHAFLQKELSDLESHLEASQELLSKYRAMIRKDLDQNMDILKACQDGKTAQMKEAAQIRKRIMSLDKAKVVSQERIEQAETHFCEAEAQVNITRLEQERNDHHSQMLTQKLLPSDLSNGALRVQDWIYDLQIEILDSKRRIHAVEADLATDAKTIQILNNDMDKTAKAVIMLPDTAVIWDVEVNTGLEVAKGDRILSYIDRSQLMVEVVFDDASIELIHPDHSVSIRMFGSNRLINGTVIRVSGSGSDWPVERFAAGVKGKSLRDGRVLVQIDDPQLYDDVERFCGVGRTAYAEFEGIGLLELYFGTFLR